MGDDAIVPKVGVKIVQIHQRCVIRNALAPDPEVRMF